MSGFGAVSRGLRRLLQLRLLEEEQRRLALETALGELSRLQLALQATEQRGRRGRQLIHHAANTGELPDRIAGLEEGRSAVRQATMLQAAIDPCRQSTDTLRAAYLAARIERRQVETLLREAEAAEALDISRRSQQALDDWYGRRRQAAEAAAWHSEDKEEP